MTKSRLQSLLDQLVETGGNPHWRFWEAERELDDWSRVELRLALASPKGLLVLRPARPSPWTRDDVLGLASPPFDGPPSATSTMPRMPPAGGDVYDYILEGKTISLTIDKASEQLVSITVEWT